MTATATGFDAIVDLLGGDDRLAMLSSSQSVVASGGIGADDITGGNAGDMLHGDAGDDTLLGGDGADALDGGMGRDTASWAERSVPVTASLHTGYGAEDSLTAIEDLLGGTGNDTLTGHNSPNILRGNDGDDVLRGTDDADTLQGGFGRDTLDGGLGVDTATWEERADGVVASLAPGGVGAEDIVDAVENLTGSQGNDTLIGNDGSNVLRGQEGDDVLRGALGSDILDGGEGIDTATWDERSDPIAASLVDDAARGGGAVEDRLPAIENLTGSKGNDVLVGDDQPNVLRGDDGADILQGGLGPGTRDTLNGGAGADTATWIDLDGPVTASLADGVGTGAGDALIAIEDLTGSKGNDELIGDDRRNVLRGDNGDDTLRGGGDADTLVGGFGRDAFDAGDGNDELNAVDTERDTAMDCGPGTDALETDDFADEPAPRRDCETVLLAGRLKTATASPNTCIAGTDSRGWCGDQGPATSAKLAGPADVAVARDGSLVIADTLNNVIRRVAWSRGGKFGKITTIAGTGERGARDTAAKNATFAAPESVAVLDAPEGATVFKNGAVLVADTGNDAIRAITGDGRVTTIVVKGARIDAPRDIVALRDGSMLVANAGSHQVLRIRANGVATVIAGTGGRGFSGDKGPATNASLSDPTQLSIAPDGSLLIADTGNGAIRSVSPKGIMNTRAGGLNKPRGVLAESDGSVLVSTPTRILRVQSDGKSSTLAGTGPPSFNGDRPAKTVRFSALSQFAVTLDDHLLVAEQGNDRIRVLLPQAPRSLRKPANSDYVDTCCGSGGPHDPIPSDPGLAPDPPPRSMTPPSKCSRGTYQGRFNEFHVRPAGKLRRASRGIAFKLVSTRRDARVIVNVYRGGERVAHRRYSRAVSRVNLGPLPRGKYVIKLWGHATPRQLRCHVRRLTVTR